MANWTDLKESKVEREIRLQKNLKENLRAVFPKDEESQRYAFDIMEKLRNKADVTSNDKIPKKVLETLLIDGFIAPDRGCAPCSYMPSGRWLDLYGVMFPYKK